ncbi:hypothetical protein [Roseateles chitinivorans]|uniref:hypothetical protein n=1 Tax=Roseateles chitinivorans TaxID=2917965 RepID=UPI003D669F8F
MTTKTIFSVRDRNGAYQTQTVQGQRASSTSSYHEAAMRLAQKLHPFRAYDLKLLDSSQHGVQVFELEVLHAGSASAGDATGQGEPAVNLRALVDAVPDEGGTVELQPGTRYVWPRDQ